MRLGKKPLQGRSALLLGGRYFQRLSNLLLEVKRNLMQPLRGMLQQQSVYLS